MPVGIRGLIKERMMKRRAIFMLSMASLAAVSSVAGADQVADFKGNAGDPTQLYPINGTPPAVVTYIIQKTAAYETFLLQDSTGAIEAYHDGAVNNSSATYLPAVGDAVSLTGYSAAFHSLFEAENNAANTSAGTPTLALSVTFLSSGNAVPTPATLTVAGLQNGSSIGLSEQSEIGILAGVHFTSNGGSGSAGTTGNFVSGGTYAVTDASGKIVTIYVPSTDTAVIGQPIPTGTTSVTGYLGQYDGTIASNNASGSSFSGYELDPTIAPVGVPEPASVSVLAFSAAGLTGCRRRTAKQRIASKLLNHAAFSPVQMISSGTDPLVI
jgi:hypothetical protein